MPRREAFDRLTALAAAIFDAPAAFVTVVDEDDNPASDTDDAVVTFTDVLPAVSIVKTADPTSVPETGGSVTLLVVLYSISVFLTFAISLFGLCLYWLRNRTPGTHWLRRLLLSLLGFVICAGILAILLVERFMHGGWAAVLIIAAIAALCIAIRRHYRRTHCHPGGGGGRPGPGNAIPHFQAAGILRTCSVHACLLLTQPFQ